MEKLNICDKMADIVALKLAIKVQSLLQIKI